MSQDEHGASEQQLADLLAAYDDALAAGRAPGPESDGTGILHAEALDRLDEDRRVVALLDRLWPRRGLDPPTNDDDFGRATITDLAVMPPVQLGRFRIVRELGRGGFGVVYLANDPLLRRAVALKVPRPEALFTPTLRERFLREARAAAGLNHPNVVPVFDSGEVGTLCYLVSAYCPGGTLAAFLRAHVGPVPARAAAALIAGLADAVAHAHARGILHRDLKPANVLLESTGAAPGPDSLGVVPRLADFGLAKFLEPDPLPAPQGATESGLAPTCGGTVLGTPEYMAPEQADGCTEAIGPGTDIHGLGVLLYELLIGRPPFQAATRAQLLLAVALDPPPGLRATRRDVPRDLEAICLRCLAKDVNQRYASAADLAADLRRFLAYEPTHARPAGRARRAAAAIRRRPIFATMLTVAIAAGLAYPIVDAWYHAIRQEHEAELQRAVERQQQREAEAIRMRELALAQQRQYVLDIAAAGRAWDAGLFNRATELLDSHAPIDGEPHEFAGRFLHALTHRRYRTLDPPLGLIYALALSPDAKLLAIGGNGGTLMLWETDSWKKLAELRGHTAAVLTLAFSPDGKLLAAGGGNTLHEPGQLKLWDVVNLRLHADLDGHPAPVNAVAFSPDGKTLAAGGGRPVGADAELRLWDVAAGACRTVVRPFEDEDAGIVSLAWENASSQLVLGDSRGRMITCDGATGAVRAVTRVGKENDALWTIALAPDGKTRALGAVSGTLTITRRDSKVPVKVLPAPLASCQRIWSLAYTLDGRCLAVSYAGSGGGAVVLWDTATWQVLDVIAMPGPRNIDVRGLAFLPDGKTLISAGADLRTQVWDLDQVQTGRMIAHDLGEAWWVAFARDGQSLFAGGDDATARRWEVATGQQQAIFRGHWSLVGSGALDPRSQELATADWHGTIRLWDARTGSSRRILSGHKGDVRAVAFSPDGATIASCGTDRVLRLWNAATGQPRWVRPAAHADAIYGVAFRPDGKVLATGSSDSTLRLWDPVDGTLLQTFPLGRMVRRLAYSANGTLLAIGATNGHVRLQRADTGETTLVLATHPVEVRALAFAPDGQTLATGGTDRLIRLWHVATGRELLTLRGHQGTIGGLAFAPDGHTLASAAHDGTVRLWRAQ